MSAYVPENPLIVQSDHTVLLEVHSPHAEVAREAIVPFAELLKSPEHIHTYRITPLSIWNARAAGLDTQAMIAVLDRYAKYPVPAGVAQEIEALGRRYGLVVLERDDLGLVMRVSDAPLAELLARDRLVAPLLGERLAELRFRIRLEVRGLLKQALVTLGYPADDLAGYAEGQELPLRLRQTTVDGADFMVRDYQHAAAAAFYQGGEARGGSGVIVLLIQPTEGSGPAGGGTAPDMDLRAYGIGAQILADLGVHQMILLINSRRNVVAIEGYGINILGERAIPAE